MSRQTIKIIISFIMLMTISTGINAIQINSNQKLQIVDYRKIIESQNIKIENLEKYQIEIEERQSQIDEQLKLIQALEHDIQNMNTQYEILKAQNEKLTSKVVYLTFDDGPSKEATLEILEILKNYDIKATFFIQGRNAVRFPEVLKTLYEAGHAIGNHSYSHNYTLIYGSEDAFWEDFNKCQETIQSIIGIEPTLFRFPGGSITASNLNGATFVSSIHTVMVGNDMQYFDWNIDCGDAASGYASAKTIKANAFAQIDSKKNAIVLLHDTDAKASTIEALPSIIEHYLSLGYRFDVLSANGFTSQFK